MDRNYHRYQHLSACLFLAFVLALLAPLGVAQSDASWPAATDESITFSQAPPQPGTAGKVYAEFHNADEVARAFIGQLVVEDPDGQARFVDAWGPSTLQGDHRELAAWDWTPAVSGSHEVFAVTYKENMQPQPGDLEAITNARDPEGQAPPVHLIQWVGSREDVQQDHLDTMGVTIHLEEDARPARLDLGIMTVVADGTELSFYGSDAPTLLYTYDVLDDPDGSTQNDPPTANAGDTIRFDLDLQDGGLPVETRQEVAIRWEETGDEWRKDAMTPATFADDLEVVLAHDEATDPPSEAGLPEHIYAVARTFVDVGGDPSASFDLVLSAGLVNIGTLESGSTRTLPLQVTAYAATAGNVALHVLEDDGLTVDVLTPPTNIGPGQTIDFHVQITVPDLDGNETAGSFELLFQAKAGSVHSNIESLNVVTHQPGFRGIPFLSPTAVTAGLVAGGALAGLFRRRH